MVALLKLVRNPRNIVPLAPRHDNLLAQQRGLDLVVAGRLVQIWHNFARGALILGEGVVDAIQGCELPAGLCELFPEAEVTAMDVAPEQDAEDEGREQQDRRSLPRYKHVWQIGDLDGLVGGEVRGRSDQSWTTVTVGCWIDFNGCRCEGRIEAKQAKQAGVLK